MSVSKNKPTPRANIFDHFAASLIAFESAVRAGNLAEALAAQELAFKAAINETTSITDFVGSPENILGSPLTKHGEIAEWFHVFVRRAWDALFQRPLSATFEGVSRTGPADYIENGNLMQSKFLNGLLNTLTAVKDHMQKYPEYAPSGSMYNIPKDFYEQLTELIESGELGGYSQKSANRIIAVADAIADLSGRPINETIYPSEGTYAEVQQGRIHEAVRGVQSDLSDEHERIKYGIHAEHKPSLGGLARVSGISFAVGGTLDLSRQTLAKYREGKNLFKGDYSAEDWYKVTFAATKGGFRAGISTGAIYTMSNWGRMPAPVAGVFVSSLREIGTLLPKYYSGEINTGEYVDMSLNICMDSIVVAIAGKIGQVIIPVPVLGYMVGNVAKLIVSSSLRNTLGAAEVRLTAELDAYVQFALARLDQLTNLYVQHLGDHFAELEGLAKTAFDPDPNGQLRIRATAVYAEAVGVPTKDVLHNTQELDVFMRV